MNITQRGEDFTLEYDNKNQKCFKKFKDGQTEDKVFKKIRKFMLKQNLQISSFMIINHMIKK